MNKIFFYLVLFLTIFGNTSAIAQVKIKGTVKNAKEKVNLPGALVTFEDASKQILKKEYVDFDGSFGFSTSAKSGTINVSLYGFETQKITFIANKSALVDLGVIYLRDNASIVKDVKVKSSSIDIVKDRKTPVASSTIRGYELKERIGNKDFVEVTSNIPGVYTSKGNGSFSESQIFIRGYNQNNMALMIDGIPISDAETGNVDWSSLMSINDAVTTVQLQRGLGASKLVNSSVAGTMNLVLRDADYKKGGYAFNTIGNDGFSKFGASFSTGKLKSGFSANMLLSRTKGDGYVDATDFEAISFYVALGFSKGKHDLQLKMFGAPQWHNQRRSKVSIATSQNLGEKYNSNWGYLNGTEASESSNYGHTPLGILQWDWNFTKNTQLSTKLYGSTGTKGQTYFAGGIFGTTVIPNANNQIDFDFINKFNSGIPVSYNGVEYVRKPQTSGKFINSLNSGLNSGAYDNTAGLSQLSEINNNTFYGGLVNFKSNLSKNFTVNLGLDTRSTIDKRTKFVNNLYGSNGYAFNFEDVTRYTSEVFEAKPSYNIFKLQNEGVSVDYKYDAIIKYLGGYGQIEYNFGKLNLFAQAGFNRQFVERIDYKPVVAPIANATGVTSKDGYNAKFGLNYNISKMHNIWANTGVVSRAPVFVSVYHGFDNFINPEIVNQKFESYEVGYGFRSRFFVFNANTYLSKHKNAEVPYYTSDQGSLGTTAGINREHKGVEADFTAFLFPKFALKGSFSYGDWIYTSNSEYKEFNKTTQSFDRSVLLTEGIKVGGAPEIMTSLGFAYELFNNFTFGSNIKYSDRLFSTADLEKYDPIYYGLDAYKEPIRLPSFAVVDGFVAYKFAFNKGHQSLDMRFNMDNILDRLYIAESSSSVQINDYIDSSNLKGGTYKSNNRLFKGLADGNDAYFGFGRTWNFNIRYEF
jgi:hypothetical protein